MVQVDKNKLIVKIQTSIASNTYKTGILVYNWDNSIYYEGEADKKMIDFVGKDGKVYAYVHYEGTELVIDGKAPIQSW